MALKSYYSPSNPIPPLPSAQCVPIIHNFDTLYATHTSYINKHLRKDDHCDGISADANLHPCSPPSNTFLRDGMFFGTYQSASNCGSGRKVSIGVEAQLHLGVRFLDFEVTTCNYELCVVNGLGELLMTGQKLFSIFGKFLAEMGNSFDEKIILNFREHRCENYVLLPTLELLADLIRSNPYFVHRSQHRNYLSKMRGVFIVFGPTDLNIALGAHSLYNWGESFLSRIHPVFRGDPSCIIRWADLERVQNYEEFRKRNLDGSRLVWLDISDPLYPGEMGHEFSSIRDVGLLFPTEEARFNIISFSSICANDIRDFMLSYKRSH